MKKKKAAREAALKFIAQHVKDPYYRGPKKFNLNGRKKKKA